MRKGLQTTKLRRELGAKSTSHVLFIDGSERGRKFGLKLGLSVEPGLKAVPGPNGRLLDGYIVPDQADADKVYNKCTSNRIFCERYAIPEVPGLAKKLLRGDRVNLNPREQRIVGRVVASYLDQATTGMNRATHYNTKEDQQRAEKLAHAAMFSIDRGAYGLLSCLSGLTDNARKLAAWMLLEWPGVGRPTQYDLQRERELITALVNAVTAPRMFQLFEMLHQSGCNNKRTRRVILTSILGSDKLDWWAVKYRRKMRRALQHAWGKRAASMVASICRKRHWTQKERGILNDHVWAYTDNDRGHVSQCVAFVLGSTEESWTVPLLKAYVNARDDLRDGRNLPPEVLEGIRSVFHKDRSHDDVLRLTSKTKALTDGQKIKHQRRLQRAGAKADFDPKRYDAIKLYVYAYERGMTAEIRDVLDEKAEQAATLLPFDCSDAVVIVDASGSMSGDETQKLRPMASALALSDMLQAAGARRVLVGGKRSGRLVRPSGDTSLALPLAKAMRDHRPSAVYVISDGYDNTPAGRFAETVRAIRQMGVSTPIYHLNPVSAAETASVRSLASGVIPTMPVQDPKSFGTALLREALEQDPLNGLRALLRQGQKALQAPKVELPKPRRRRSVAVTQRLLDVVGELSPTMRDALVDMDRVQVDGKINYRGAGVRPQTVEALRRRRLVKKAGRSTDYVLYTKLGQQAAAVLQRPMDELQQEV